MATKKRGKGARPATKRTAARRAKPSAARSAKKAAPRRAAAAKARGTGKRPARAAAAATPSRELAALKARFQRDKSDLEKRLTDTVREIGHLRHHEARAAHLERQLKERDETISQLRAQLSALRDRELAPPDDEEVQPSLALGSRAAHDLDEFDDDAPEDDDELI